MVNVGKYTIHGSYGKPTTSFFLFLFTLMGNLFSDLNAGGKKNGDPAFWTTKKPGKNRCFLGGGLEYFFMFIPICGRFPF